MPYICTGQQITGYMKKTFKIDVDCAACADKMEVAAQKTEGVKEAVLTAVNDAGPNACPPMVIGVGIGGTFEKCALMAKKALTRNVNERSKIPYVAELETELLDKINCLGLGPGGLGGRMTALNVAVETYPTHIAGLPVAVNICCHVNRHIVREI